jgi:hypothetical protein
MHIFYLFSAVIHTWSDNLGALKELDLAVVLLFFFYLFSAVIHTWSDNLGALKELDLAVVLLFFYFIYFLPLYTRGLTIWGRSRS